MQDHQESEQAQLSQNVVSDDLALAKCHTCSNLPFISNKEESITTNPNVYQPNCPSRHLTMVPPAQSFAHKSRTVSCMGTCVQVKSPCSSYTYTSKYNNNIMYYYSLSITE